MQVLFTAGAYEDLSNDNAYLLPISPALQPIHYVSLCLRAYLHCYCLLPASCHLPWQFRLCLCSMPCVITSMPRPPTADIC
jgi:hypothetical protein